jgi:hypothetical protein
VTLRAERWLRVSADACLRLRVTDDGLAELCVIADRPAPLQVNASTIVVPVGCLRALGRACASAAAETGVTP